MFRGKNTFLREQGFCFYDIFKKHISGHNEIWEGNLEETAHECPVTTGLAKSVMQNSCILPIKQNNGKYSTMTCFLCLKRELYCVTSPLPYATH